MERIILRPGTLYTLSGLPGAGKSQLQNNARNLPPGAWVSSDALREQILGFQANLDPDGAPMLVRFDDANGTVFSTMRAIVRERLALGLLTIVDATNLTDGDRKEWAELAKDAGVPFEVLIVGTSLDDCIRNNKLRGFRIPEHRIHEMHTPPAPVIPESVLSKLKPGQEAPMTMPQGFMLTSKYPYRVISNDDILEARPHELEHTAYDVIGDVHGLLEELLQLLAKAGWKHENGRLSHPQGRKLLFLGDLVDRGNYSIEVLKLVRQAVLDGVAKVVMGNHDKKLVNFFDKARAGKVGRWGSNSNAETGMKLYLMEKDEAAKLVDFIRGLPAHYVWEDDKVAFVHGDIHSFEPLRTPSNRMVYGESSLEDPVDSDAEYEKRYKAGVNRYVMFRGHIPQTSPQPHVFSLERHPFQRGELVLMRLDVFLAACKDGKPSQEAFQDAILTQKTEFDYDEKAKQWGVLNGMEDLAEKQLATCQMDDSGMLRVYKYSKQTFWNHSWGESEWLMKARGMVLDVAGNIISHPFDKCFNYREGGTGLDLSDDHKVIEVEKLNGYLGLVTRHPFSTVDLLMHTQGGFGGEAVEYLREYAYERKTRPALSRFLARNDVTLMFEVLHPNDPHIIEYPKEMMGLHLIGIRNKGLHDLPWTEEAVDAAAKEMGLRRPKWQRTTFGEVRERMRDSKTEGCMVREDDEKQVTLLKFKTPYYLTTKFLGRLSRTKIAHMYGNPKDFKKTVDEEFYPIVDELVTAVEKDALIAQSDDERVVLVRGLINQLQ
jgi:predicted kinase